VAQNTLSKDSRQCTVDVVLLRDNLTPSADAWQEISQVHLHTHVNSMNHAFAFPTEAGPHFTDPGGMEG